MPEPNVEGWDGKTSDFSWYDPEKTVYYIKNASQLSGFRDLVNLGHNFSGKTVKLSSDINLNHKEWVPIGAPCEIAQHKDEKDVYIRPIVDRKTTFTGSFDGCGYAIYGLHITEKSTTDQFVGLFRTLDMAVVQDLVLADVFIDIKDGNVGCLVGYSNRTLLSNIVTDGTLRGRMCGGITCMSTDTSFYYCVSNASIETNVEESSDIAVGGITSEFQISDEFIRKSNGTDALVFIKCVSTGKINIDGSKAKAIYAGGMYGYMMPSVVHGIVIDRCTVQIANKVRVDNLNVDMEHSVFYAHIGESDHPSVFIRDYGQKFELLDGIIGRTPDEVAMRVYKATQSHVIDSVVLPGSLNTLLSNSYENVFRTIDTTSLEEKDSIFNLSPYFKYVGTGKKRR